MTTPPESKPGVLHEAWERELIAGQTEAGEAGDLEADLAMVHLLRHARAPEALRDEDAERVLTQVRAATRPRRFWEARWARLARWVAVPAAAGLVALVLSRPEEGLDGLKGGPGSELVARAPGDRPSVDAEASEAEASLAAEAAVPADGATPDAAATRPLHEVQFAALAPSDRASVRDVVGRSRTSVRHDWLLGIGGGVPATGGSR